ncbi:MAG: hypothetical protein ACTSUG_18000, partial [Candidatus Helarchaeota archaeon]
NQKSKYDDKKVKVKKDDSNIINRLISTTRKFINDSQKKLKRTFENLKISEFFNTDWVQVLSILSNPIAMDFMIDGIPKIFYDVFDYDDDIEIIIDIPNVPKENIQIKTHYKTIKIYVKEYLIEKIDLSKYLKRGIKVKNVNCQYEGRILKIKIIK